MLRRKTVGVFMTSAIHYVPENPLVKKHTEELPRWQREIVTAQTDKVAAMTNGSKEVQELLQRAYARVDRRKRRH